MHSNYYRYQCSFLKLFFIFIIFFSIQGCSSSSSKPQARPSTYKIVKGDTLFSIAWRYGIKYQDLAKYNGISSPYKIHPNQVLRLYPKPSSTKVIVASKSSPAKTNVTYSKNNRSNNKTGGLVHNKNNRHQAGAIVWHWPSKGSVLKHFGGDKTLNKGIDIGGNLGEPVLAAAVGEVVYAGSGLRGYGKLLIVRHSDSFLSAYAHNNRLLVKEGDFVKAGQKIADMGSSGTNGVKLHFEIRRDGNPEDPMKYLPRR
jgi:lipoprotein NlpD